jgi:hypothetical protein
MVKAFGNIVQNTQSSAQMLSPKIFCQISAQMLVKQNSNFCAVYFVLVRLFIAQIGR